MIRRDDEHALGARITLEEGGRHPWSITCGVYGWMVHTRFFAAEQEAEHEYARMKVALEEILDMIPTEDRATSERTNAVTAALSRFVDRFD